MLSAFFTRFFSWLLAADVQVRRGLVWIQRHRGATLALSLGVIAISLFAPHVALADTPPAETKPDVGIVGRIVLIIAEIILWVALLVGRLVTVLIEVIIVPIMQYNNFSNSPVVSAGWTIVRDSVNLFFVIVLIVIAVGTIFGAERFHWQQQVPRLLIMAVVINFSKTLCGIMIDASQVFMLTFVNALKDIAGGNFITMLGLNEIVSINPNAPGIGDLATAGAQAAGPFEFFASSVAALLMMTLVFAVLVALAAILAFRIVMLWVLVTIAPIAWFIKGAEGVISSNAYSEWWNNFKCQLAIGPVITFFLWLALAVAGAGNIAATESFVSGAGTGGAATGGFVTGIFQLGRLTSFIIGMAMIFAGFKAAADFCSGVEGGSFITGALGKAKALGLKAPAGLMARYTARGGRGLLSRGASLAGGAASRIPLARNVLTRQGQAGMFRGIQKGLGAAGGVPVVGGALMGVAGLAGKAAAQRGQVTTEAIKQAGQSLDDKEQAKIYASVMSKKNRKAVTMNDQMKDMNLLTRAMKDPKLQEAMGPGGFKKMMGIYGNDLKQNFHEDYDTFEKKRPDLTGSVNKIDTEEDARNLDKAAYEDAAVREKLKTIAGKEKDKTAYDEILEGKHGNAKRDALSKLHPEAPPAPPAPPPPPTADLFKGGRFDAKTGQFADDADEQAFAENLKQNITAIGNIDPTAITKNSVVVNMAAEQLDAGKMQRLFKDYLRGDDAKKAELTPTFQNAKSIVDLASADATGSDKERLDKLKKQMEHYIGSAGISVSRFSPAPAAAAPRAEGETPTGTAGGGTPGGTLTT